MAVLATFEKQPADVMDYDIDYTQWLPSTDSVASVSYTVTPSGALAVNSALVIENGTRVKLWVSGGTNASTYKAEVTVTTVLGRIKQDEVRFRVKEY